MKSAMNVLILLIQSIGVLLVGIGLEMIWEPLAWIYYGVAFFVLGHAMYLAKDSEERKK